MIYTFTEATDLPGESAVGKIRVEVLGTKAWGFL